MIDQIFDNNGDDIDLQTAFIEALGEDDGKTVLADVLAKNPQFTASSKRLEVSVTPSNTFLSTSDTFTDR
jgi:hypothetical protein